MFTRDYEDLGVKLPSWQNVAKIIGDVIANLPVRNIRISVQDPDIEIFADPLLQKVFYNLIDNALKYGGEKMTEIHIDSRQKDTDLVIVVQDDGNGISANDKRKLFRKGFGKHTGLGLFLSREILAITDIIIRENGVPGDGARFEIIIPNGMYRYNIPQ